ncbi:MAG: NACHT domain-containing protein, partial [candidate division KSB1 bacterium]|nr:NACHT domain-containing protein [candidate division KSB1 bacterium]
MAIDYNVRFESRRWLTDAYPGFDSDGPQGIIDRVLDIENCDILIGIFRTRFGKPTRQADSGTEHEIRAAIKSWEEKGSPHIMIYFLDFDFHPKNSEEAEQYARLLRFKEDFPPQGLYWTYQNTEQFERLVRLHLTQYLRHELTTDFKPDVIPKTRSYERQVVQSYCQRVKQRFSTINLFGERGAEPDKQESVIDRMSDMDVGFIPLKLQQWLDEAETATARPLEIDQLFFNDASPRHVLLRGLPGSGKTTLLRYLTYRFASQGAEGEKKLIPVYLRCKRLNLNQTPLPDFVMQQINEDCENRNIYLTLTAADNFLETPMILLFDGLDEIEDEATSQRIAEELVRLRNNCPRCRIIIASRPIGLKKEKFPGFYPAELLPLDEAMIQNYLQRWFKNDAERIDQLLGTFQRKPRIAALATNPFLLSMICFTFQHGGDTALIERRSDLYANCTKYLLQRRYADDSHARVSDAELEKW